MPRTGGNPSDSRTALLNAVRELGALSRKQAAAAAGLSLSSAKRLVERLLAERLLEESEGPAGQERKDRVRGPKAGRLRLRGQYGCALGLSLEPGRIQSCAVSLSGEVLKLDSHRLEDRGSEGAIRQLAGITRSARAALPGRLLGIGVVIAGLVDARRGFVYDCYPIPGWENVPLRERLEAEVGAAVLVDDRVRGLAVAEKRYGAARALENFLYVDVGSGVGSCFFLDGRIYRGQNGLSGELGHIPVRENGPQCNCGNKGCLEVMVSSGSLTARVNSALEAMVYSQLKSGREISLQDVAAAAGLGDKLAGLLVFDTAELIGIGLADLVSVFDPGTIILAGEVARGLGAPLVEGIVRTVRLRGMHPITQRTRFLNGSDIPHLGAWGAATLPLEHWFGSGVLNI
jgi:predicted NBD/HSP70 family sugar kinase